MRTFTMTIDHLPSRKLMPNRISGKFWGTRARESKIAKEEAYFLARALWHEEPMQKAKISYVFHLTNHRVRDIDGIILALKPVVDGIVEAGVIARDDCWHLTLGSARPELDNCEKVVITIKEQP